MTHRPGDIPQFHATQQTFQPLEPPPHSQNSEQPSAIAPPERKRRMATAIEQAFEHLGAYNPTELGNCLMLVRLYKNRLRHDPKLDIWLARGSSGVWREDTRNMMEAGLREANAQRLRWAQTIPADHGNKEYLECREAHIKWVAQSERSSVAKGAMYWARTMPEFATDPAKWDADKTAVGTPSGIFDLTTGVQRPSDVEYWVSKSTSVPPAAPGTPCPEWEGFLQRVMRGDAAKVSYLKRLSGYALTGHVKEQSLIWFVGGGGNGKGIFIDTLLHIFGDYAHSLRSEVLMASKHDVHPTEVLDLKGKRLCVASEVDEGRQWRESRLKQLTGGDAITARRVHKDSLTFFPTHTLIISCNAYPQLPAVGQSERRRFQILEWDVTFKRADDATFDDETDMVRDDSLSQKLEAEYPAILRWAMDGVREWMAEGLNPPPSVIYTSRMYMEDEDLLQQWIDEALVQTPDCSMPSSESWQSWQTWCQRRGVHPGSGIKFLVSQLKRKGFKLARTSQSRRLLGLRLRASDEMGVTIQ
jgi:P4 family phage/plasmid primase-like protien